jgi:hypothetical protein
MGIHEANQETGSGHKSPAEYFYRLHMDVMLANRAEMQQVHDDLEAGNWEDLRRRLIVRVDHQRAAEILRAALQPKGEPLSPEEIRELI